MRAAVLGSVVADRPWGVLSQVLWWALLTAAVPAALYLVLFAQIPAVHDVTHELRHTLTMVACH
ncbi:MAG: CbtB-domain containing protein [Clostridia bacterium]|nr:CbtB-domain containing protein [Clostridia bacterium]